MFGFNSGGGGTIQVSNPTKKAFIVKTYFHVFLGLAMFMAMIFGMYSTGLASKVMSLTAMIPWLVVLLIFNLAVGWASGMAYKVKTLSGQYLAMTLFIFLWAILSLPLFGPLFRGQGEVVINAGLVTLISFSLLTLGVYLTKTDFSFLGGILRWLGIVAIACIVTSILGPYLFGTSFNFHLGTWFSIMMIAYSGMAILYNTSKIMLHMPSSSRYVGASLALIADIIMMFWYILRYMRR